MGLFSRSKPKIKVQTAKRDGFNGWLKCTHCHEMIHLNELEKNQHCCPKCDAHYRLSAQQRIHLLADEGSFQELFQNIKSADPLEFADTAPYKERIVEAREKSKSEEAVKVGVCRIREQPVALGVMDFNFMGGSMGSVVGERLTLLIEHAIEHRLPVIIVSASGGARMQESTLSLMQMAKISAALGKLSEARLLYISLLTNPTTGGVTASFAALGDLIVAEPNALIGFTGPRVIEQTIRQKLPPGAQRSEFIQEHGFLDCIVHRHEMKTKIADMLSFLVHNERIYSVEAPDSARVSLSLKLRELISKEELQTKAK